MKQLFFLAMVLGGCLMWTTPAWAIDRDDDVRADDDEHIAYEASSSQESAKTEAKFPDDPIEDGYFGCGGVAEIPHLQDKCITLAKGGFKHHTAICEGHYKDILKEAFTTYLGYDWVDID